MTCQEVKGSLLLYITDELDHDSKKMVQGHISVCTSCVNAERDERFFSEELNKAITERREALIDQTRKGLRQIPAHRSRGDESHVGRYGTLRFVAIAASLLIVATGLFIWQMQGSRPFEYNFPDNQGYVKAEAGSVVNHVSEKTFKLDRGRLHIHLDSNIQELTVGTESATVEASCVDNAIDCEILIEGKSTVIKVRGGNVMVTGNAIHDKVIANQGDIVLVSQNRLEVKKAEAKGDNLIWQATASLSRARSGHAALLLTDEKILVIGGFWQVWNDVGNTFGWLGDSEIYDSRTAKWRKTGSMNKQRESFGVILLPTGRVLVCGGATSKGMDKTCEEWDPETGTWSYVGEMQEKRGNAGLVLLSSGKVLAVGGYRDTKVCELYDPQTKRWSATGNLNYGRAGHTTTLLPSGKVLITGGNAKSQTELTIDLCEIYDPKTETWSYTQSMKRTRMSHTATLLSDGRVLVVGGAVTLTTDIITTSSCEIYDPKTDKWTSTGSMTAERSCHTATLLQDGKVLVVGGENKGMSLGTCELYDPAAGTWTSVNSLATAKSGHAVAQLSDRIMVIAGRRTCQVNRVETLSSCEFGIYKKIK